MTTLTHSNLPVPCCPTDPDFTCLYGQAPTGISPGNLGPVSTSELWQQMFGNLEGGWWGETSCQWVNPFNRHEQNPRNCIDFHERCSRNDRISLTLPNDCCGNMCASVTEQLDILKRYPKAQTKTVRVLGPTKMAPNTVSPPIPLEDLWQFTIDLLNVSLQTEEYYRYQVSRNGNSWTTLPREYISDPGAYNIYTLLFDDNAEPCPTSCQCIPHPDPAIPDQRFPDTNAFWGTNAISGAARAACPPKYGFFRIIAIRAVCVESITAIYANGKGLCSSLPSCPQALVYDNKVCRPLPARSCPGMAAPKVGGPGHPTHFDKPIYPDLPTRNINATRNRQLKTIAQQVHKHHPGGMSASQHTRNVRAVARPPWNSRATTDNSRGMTLNARGYACNVCKKVFRCQCGVGCNDGPLPPDAPCAVPAKCRRKYAAKHQYGELVLDDLVACATAGCRMATGQSPCTIKQAA